MGDGWNVAVSEMALNTFNPIRAIVDGMKIKPNPDKEMIPLSIGDPTVFGNLKPPKEAVEAIKEAVQSGKYNGYAPSHGYLFAREAVAKLLTEEGVKTTPEDVFLTSGCSNAIELAISALVNPGETLLIPRPGFSLYRTISLSQGIKIKSYNCLPEKMWEADLEHMRSLIDDTTKAIVVVNPSNPCGSNFKRSHIKDILELAEEYKIPIISDEIYAEIVFKPTEFVSCASQTTTVPILTCGGISKRFLVPGWRLGWVVMHDKNNVFGEKMRAGLVSLTQRILGACTLVQAILPAVLGNTDRTFIDDIIAVVQTNAEYAFEHLSQIPGLMPVKPEAAYYMMVGINTEDFPEFQNEVEFTECMITEQSVFCLPATCFDYPGYFRIVLTVPKDVMVEACKRIEEFCRSHVATGNTRCAG